MIGSFCGLPNIPQAKQLQIDDLLAKLDNASGDLERLREEKDQEIAIMQEGMDSTIQQLLEAQQVRILSIVPTAAAYSALAEPRAQ